MDMDRTGPIALPIKSEADFERWLLAVLADQQKRLREQKQHLIQAHDEWPAGVAALTISNDSAAASAHNFGGNND